MSSIDATSSYVDVLAELSGSTGAIVGIVLVGLGAVLVVAAHVLESVGEVHERVGRRGCNARSSPRLSGVASSVGGVPRDGHDRHSVPRGAGVAMRP